MPHSKRMLVIKEWLDKFIENAHAGDMLPSDKSIAEKYFVSQRSILRLLQQYSIMGKLERIQGRGTFIPGKNNRKPQFNFNRMSSAEVLIEKFRELISSGEFKRTEAAPSVKYMSLRFKVSEKTVIRAYSILQSQQFITKIGKTFWIGSFSACIKNRRKKTVYIFVEGEKGFNTLFSNDTLSLAYLKMEKELRTNGYVITYKTMDQLSGLREIWLTEKTMPDALIFHRIAKAKEAVLWFVKDMISREDIPMPGVFIDMVAGMHKKVPANVTVLSRGNLYTTRSRMVARYLIDNGIREAALCYDSKDISIRFWSLQKIFWEIRNMDPHFRLYQIFPKTNRIKTSEDLWSFIIKEAPAHYNSYSASKYSENDIDRTLENQIIITDNMFRTCYDNKNIRSWIFTNDNVAFEAYTWCIAKKIMSPDDIHILGLEDNPSFYHSGVSTISLDWDKTGYMIAHSLMRDIPIKHTSKGYLSAEYQIVHRETTKP